MARAAVLKHFYSLMPRLSGTVALAAFGPGEDEDREPPEPICK